MAKQKTKGFLFRMFCGFFLGISIIAPGVSGSVMAVMMGIYGKLITIISHPFRNFKKNVIYLIPMGIGAVLSILMFIQLFHWLFQNHPTPGFLLFMGLIGGSLPMVLREARDGGPFKKKYIIGIIGAFAFAITIGMLARFEVFVPGDNVNVIYLSISGAIAGATSMIPGMSVSIMLMMLGVYTPLLTAAANFDIITVLPVIICFVIGMVLFSRFTKHVFDNHHSLAYYMVFGFMAGSVISIFPGLPKGLGEWLVSLVMIAAGLGIAYLFQKLSKKFNVDDEVEKHDNV